jgi:hypothetical protein
MLWRVYGVPRGGEVRFVLHLRSSLPTQSRPPNSSLRRNLMGVLAGPSVVSLGDTQDLELGQYRFRCAPRGGQRGAG